MPRPNPAHTQEEGISCHKSKLQKHEVTTKVAEWHLSQTNAEPEQVLQSYHSKWEYEIYYQSSH